MKEKILIALSDQSLINILSKKLNEEGYVPIVANRGEEALDIMHSQSPDLALIDLVLPGKNGYDVLCEKSLDRFITKIPIIIISNYGAPIEMRKIPSTSSIKDYIIKTHVEPDDVLEKINAAFGRVYEKTDEKGNIIGKPQGKKILWAEDDKLLSTILFKKFESYGHTILKAKDSNDTFTFLENEKPDIIILDILLPGMNGLDILQKIKMNEKLRNIPVMILSNLSKESDIEKAKMLGAQKFVVKAAVSLDEIVKEVEELTKT